MSKFNHASAGFRICVDGSQCGRISGRVFSQRLLAPISFSDISDLLLKLEEVLDVQKFPQAFERTRSFTEIRLCDPAVIADSLEHGMSRETVEAQSGAFGTFLLFVITRRNTTWQGHLDWLDGSPQEHYNSVLELLKLADQHIFTPSN